ncbi:MAG: type IV pili twitching motility protein PilT [Proteobacteria bacterium SG_bin7]|nr:MAG: type IV pili twitching motility protein PilT [Proteobacteria bacterium SG_bin7]
MNLTQILSTAVSREASDVHLKAGIVPVIRKHGMLRPLDESLQPLSPETLHKMAFDILDETQKKTLDSTGAVDIGYGIAGLGRFRVNIFKQRGTLRMVMRLIPHDVPDIDQINVPAVIKKLALESERGLVLVTGMTGSGKSTTLAAMVNYINQHRNRHIVMIEDPIEFLIRDYKCIISQVELGTDAVTYPQALKNSLRQDPDIILIGEMRDLETVDTAMTAAETGHLVFSTLHTTDAIETINRILSVYPAHQHQQIRYQLAAVLKAIISQRLITRPDGKGFVPAVEVLINSGRVKELILAGGKAKEMQEALETGRTAYGMQSFDQSLMELIAKNLITYEAALQASSNPKDFAVRFSGIKGHDAVNWVNKDGKTADNRIWDQIQELELQTNLSHINKKGPKKK